VIQQSFLKKRVHAVLLLGSTAVFLLQSLPAGGTIVGSTGNVTVLGSPPSSVAPGTLEDNLLTRVFFEKGVVLTSTLTVDNTSTGNYPPNGALGIGIPAGTAISSYFFHFDPVAASTTRKNSVGTVTFDRDILGVIFTTSRLNATDLPLGAPGTAYTPAHAERQVELLSTQQTPPVDTFTISADRRTMSFSFFASSSQDQMRVILGNGKPISNAGPDQTVNEGDLVTLNGSGSTDPEGDPLAYRWTQVAGTPDVILSSTTTVAPTFSAPSVPRGGTTLTFELVVSDGLLASESDTVNVTIKDVNRSPVALAGDDQAVKEGSPVTLDGSASYDPDGDPITYSWLQTAGSGVLLSSNEIAQPTFSAPFVGSAGEALTFSLTVDDGLAAHTDTVNVTIENVNHPPTANAGEDLTHDENSQVTLNASQSSDPDGDPLTYAWSQISGPAVVLEDVNSPTAKFRAPSVEPGGIVVEFQVVVSDGALSSSDTVRVNVLNINDPPACELGRADPAALWPPNHKMMPVHIVGVADPNNDGIAISVTGVTQDEPVEGVGDGDTSPDAVRQGSTVQLRAERAANGDGRVYNVEFTADDGAGGVCGGVVQICVPRVKGSACTAGGQQFSSE
jgi:hypothetical protein